MKRLPAALLCLLFCLPLFFSEPAAAEESLKAFARKVQQRYDRLDSLSFTFSQQTSGEMTGRPRSGEGSALFLRKDGVQKMRWEYTLPDQQLIVSDGTTIKLYFKELQQMIVAPAESMAAELTYSFFSGGGDLTGDFEILPPDDEVSSPAAGMRSIKLIPRRPQQQVQDIHLDVDADHMIRRLAIRDHFGTVTTMQLAQIKENPLATETPAQLEPLFSFTPPDGTEIIKQDSLY